MPVALWFAHPGMQLLLPKTRRPHIPGLFASRRDLFLHHACAGGRRRGRVNSVVAMETGEDGWRRIPAHAATGGMQHLLPTQPTCMTPAADHTPVTEGDRKTPQ